MCKCKVCISRGGITKAVCWNPNSNNYTDFVSLENSCKEGIEEMPKEDYDKYVKGE